MTRRRPAGTPSWRRRGRTCRGRRGGTGGAARSRPPANPRGTRGALIAPSGEDDDPGGAGGRGRGGGPAGPAPRSARLEGEGVRAPDHLRRLLEQQGAGEGPDRQRERVAPDRVDEALAEEDAEGEGDRRGG